MRRPNVGINTLIIIICKYELSVRKTQCEKKPPILSVYGQVSERMKIKCGRNQD